MEKTEPSDPLFPLTTGRAQLEVQIDLRGGRARKPSPFTIRDSSFNDSHSRKGKSRRQIG